MCNSPEQCTESEFRREKEREGKWRVTSRPSEPAKRAGIYSPVKGGFPATFVDVRNSDSDRKWAEATENIRYNIYNQWVSDFRMETEERENNGFRRTARTANGLKSGE